MPKSLHYQNSKFNLAITTLINSYIKTKALF